MSDIFNRHNIGFEAPFVAGFPIQPNSTAYFAQTTRALYVGGGGNVVVQLYNQLTESNSAPLTFYNVPAGTVLPVRAIMVFANSSANLIVGLY